MFSGQTFELILQRMLDRVSNNVDKREGSVIWDANASAAVELKLIYLALEEMLNEAFGDTASREFLIRRAAERGLTPITATQTELTGSFTPTNIDVTGRRFSMPNSGLTYIVEDLISSDLYKVRCEQPGAQGNRFLGTIIPIDHIQGLQTAELIDITVFGRDVEDTEALRQR